MPGEGEERRELLRLAGALAEESRLRSFAAVVLGAASEEEVASRTGLSKAAVRRALGRLAAAGLVTMGRQGLSARVEAIERAVRAVRRQERAAEPSAFELGATPEQARTLDRYLAAGRLASIPVRGRKRTVVLDFLAGHFVPGRRYRESEVNEILAAFNDDVASLRRYLVDEGFLERSEGLYWRSGGTFSVE